MLNVSRAPEVPQRTLREPPPTAEHFRGGMLTWAEPVIADRIADAYADCGLGGAYRSLLTIHHRRLWRALILDQRGHLGTVRNNLLQDAARAGLDPDAIEDIDHEVLEELMDVVMKRFRSSRDMARDCGRVLLTAASNLGWERARAA